MADAFCVERRDRFNNEKDLEIQRRVEKSMKTGSYKTIYDVCVSLHNSFNSRSGKLLETSIEEILTTRKIPFLRQVSVKNGIISPKKRGAVHDIIIDAKLGDNIRDKVMISCKTSVRDRYKQDGKIDAKKLYLFTYDRPSDFEKYIEVGITLITIGNGALEAIMTELAEQFAEQS